LLGALLGLIHPLLATPLLQIAAWAARLLIGLSDSMATLNFLIFHGQPNWPLTLGLSTLGMSLWVRHRSRWLMMAIALVWLGWGGLREWLDKDASSLEVFAIDVGQGDSTLVRLPDGFTLLIDGGGSENRSWDPGQLRVVPFLRHLGIKKIDLVVASHPHADHVAGLGAVFEAMEVKELWTCWHGAEANPWYKELIHQAQRHRLIPSSPRRLLRGRVKIEPLWPLGYEGFCADPGYSTNSNSIVLRIEYGQSVVLFPGDIEEEVEEELVERYGVSLRANVLKVPHHGSPSSSSPAFIQAVSPQLAIISAAPANAFGFPDSVVLERYLRQQVQIVRTDRVGAVRIRVKDQGEAATWQAMTPKVP
jgi:competence protein ComEC